MASPAMPLFQAEALPSSDASRPGSQPLHPAPRSGILTPASDGSLNRPSSREGAASRPFFSSSAPPLEQRSAIGNASKGSATITQQRLGAAPPMEELLKPSFVIMPHPPNLLAKPITLQPLMLLPRECLPLSSIDLAAPYGELPAGGRFFESRIRILDLEGRLGCNVLVARSESSRASYAIERQDNGHYVVCKLGTWIDMAGLSRHATVLCRQRIVSRPPSAAAAQTFEPALVTPSLYKENKRKRLAIEEIQSLVRKRARSQSVATSVLTAQPAVQPPAALRDEDGHELEHEQAQVEPPKESLVLSQLIQTAAPVQAAPSAPTLVPSSQAAADDNLDAQQTAEGIFQNIRAQYFETLYRSMGSVAYFAKGPLSRARAAFHLNCDSNLEMSDLIDFLKNLVLSTVLVDKKYLSAIPEMIDQMKLLVESTDDGQTNHRRAKKKQTKKMKLDKNGMYPGEAESVRKWWTATKPELRDDETSVSPEQVRYHISCLRRRETFLQMILVLEILALEATRPAENAVDVQLPGLTPATPAKPAHADGAKKKRNKHNFPVLLDVHADRLCIWESTTLDDVKALAESQSRGREGRKSEKPLADFCVDVILPFFSARLPEFCASLNRKLGGPVITKSDPKLQRREKSKPKPGSAATAPSAAARRGHAKSSSADTRSLQRVLSNDRLRRSVSRGPADALAHLRHATIAPIPGLKREPSEGRALKDVPALGGATTTNGSTTTTTTTSMSSSGPAAPVPLFQRSTSFTQYEEVKSQKKARVEAELRDAISALKKPNRELAGRTMTEETERRLFGGPQYVKKTKAKPPTRMPVDHVQVKATPANTRFRDALAGEATLQAVGRGGFNLARAHYRGLQQPQQQLQPQQQGLATGTFADGDSLVAASSPCVVSTPMTKKSARHQTLLQPGSSASGSAPASSRRLLQVPAREGIVPASSPRRGDMPQVPVLNETPVKKPRPRPDLLLAATPIKLGGFGISVEGAPASGSSAAAAAVPATPAPHRRREAKSAAPAGQLTIYQQLGWEDDYADDLA